METFDCCIIGSGLAGASVALYAKYNKLSSIVIESNDIGSGASGNQLGGLIPYLTSPSFPAHKFYENGFAKTFELLTSFEKNIINFWSGNACQFPSNDRPKRIFEGKINSPKIVIHNKNESKDLLGVTSKSDFFLYDKAAYLSPIKLCRYLINNYADKTILNTHVNEFSKYSDYYQIYTTFGNYKAKNVIIAAAVNSSKFPETNMLDLKPVRGQVSLIQNNYFFDQIKIPLCYNGYFLPGNTEKQSLLGTTYDYKYLDSNPCKIRNQNMLHTLSTWIEDTPNIELDLQNTRVSFRTVSKDKLPIIGKLSENLFISTAHGSRGLHSSFIGAEYIVSKISNKKVNEEIFFPVLPNRFL